MLRQKPTNPDTPDWTLTPQQETAVDLLASGDRHRHCTSHRGDPANRE